MSLQPVSATHRILIVQDVPDSAKQQRDILDRHAATQRLQVSTHMEDLRVPADHLIATHLQQSLWDWLVLDLLISPTEDHQPLESSGMNLMRRIHNLGLFHGYRKRVQAGNGVRCVAVYSATLDRLGPTHRSVKAELARCGVREANLYQPGQMRQVANDICAELMEI